MTGPTPIRPAWTANFWADTETETLHWLIEMVDVFKVQRRALFLATLADELERRREIPPAPDKRRFT